MRSIFKYLKWPLILFVALISVLYLTGNSYVIKAVSLTYGRGNTGVSIDDYEYFNNRFVLSDGHQPWEVSKKANSYTYSDKLNSTHKEMGTIAYLVIKDDRIIIEEYWEGYGKKSRSNSFSMAKTIVTMLMQIAIQEKYIISLDQKVSSFFPKFAEGLNSELSVGDLSRMSSGLNWEESYTSPFSVTTQAYFGTELDELTLSLDVTEQPGQNYKYLSGNTQLLAMIISKATGRSLSAYASEKLWKPLGASSDAYWMLDKENGREKAYCCFNSNARDFARFGKLWLQKGKWNNKVIIDEEFVDLSIKPSFPDTNYYGYSWWLDSESFGTDVHFMRGILGQYVINVPEHNLIIVRLGHKRDGKDEGKPHPRDFYIYVEETLKMLKL